MLAGRGPRVAAKLVWLVVLACAVVRTTPALGASFWIEPTSDALAAERAGDRTVLWMCGVLAVLAAAAWFAFDPPRWAVGLLGLTALVLAVATTTPWAYLAIPLPYVLGAAAAVGVVGLPSGRGRGGVSRG